MSQKGRFSDGRSATSRPVIVSVTPAGLDIRGEDGLLVAFWLCDDINVEPNLPGGRTRISCHADPDARLLLEGASFSFPTGPVRIPRRGVPAWLRWGAACLGAMAVMGGLALALPLASSAIALMIPPETEHRWAAQVVPQLDRQWPACRGEAGQAALTELVARLGASLPEAQRPQQVRVANVAAVNAIALPGGTIVVFRGLLAAVQDPDELAGVLGHEMTHIAQRHPLAGFIRGMGVGVVVLLITGDTSGAAATAAALAVANAYTRKDEAAADAGGVHLLTKAGIGTAGMERFFHRMEKDAMPAWLSSHPDSLARAKAVAAAGPATGEPALAQQQWAALKAICN